MTNLEFAEKACLVAEGTKTVYMWGTFGAPVTETLIRQKSEQYPSRYSAARKKLLRGLIGKNYWAWDCVGLIKGILWGWDNDPRKRFGGAVYESHGVPDTNVTGMKKACYDRSGDMNTLVIGEVLFLPGHMGIYVGNGNAAEATLNGSWDGVVITPLSARKWTEHGKLPYVDYLTESGRPEVGDTVYFLGGKHYVSSDGSLGYSARPGEAKITKYAAGQKHPYHLIHTDRKSNVYGWVDADRIRI